MKTPTICARLRTLVIVVLLLCGSATDGLSHGPRYRHIATSATIAEDAHRVWTAQEIADGMHDHAFEPVEDSVPNLQFTQSAFWMRFELQNTRATDSLIYLETGRPLTNIIHLYRIRDGKAELLFRGGDDLPFTERPITYRKFIFPVTMPANSREQYLFQLVSDGEVISAPIKCWEPANFNGYVQRENLTMGIFFGLIIFVAGLFLFFAFLMKQKLYTYYVSYVIFLFFMQAAIDGLAFEYIWPNSTWLANHSILFFSGASVFMLMLYAAEFLQLQTMPRWFRIMYRTFLSLVFVCILTSVTEGPLYALTYPVINALSLVALLAIIAAIVWRRANNEHVNLFFSLGFIAVLLGGIVFIFTNFNVISSDFLSQNAIKLGSAAEITFLSLAMVSRYRDVQKEKEDAQQQAYDTLQTLNAITQNQNERLERIVVQRTAEIREANDQLEEKNKEIIDSITYARRIQTAILPDLKLLHLHLPKSFVLYLPKDIVAGDFYWMETLALSAPENPAGDAALTNDVVLFAAADCTGHGVPGAMVSVVCHNALNRAVREYRITTPADILDKVAAMVEESFQNTEEEVKDGMDISLCCFQKSTQTLSWAGANNPIWIVTPELRPEWGEPDLQSASHYLYEIKADKQPIGQFAHRTPYTGHTRQLRRGDAIYVFSDGFADQFGGEKGKKYKSRQMKEFVLGMADVAIYDQREMLHQEFTRWRGNIDQIDDVCVIGVQA